MRTAEQLYQSWWSSMDIEVSEAIRLMMKTGFMSGLSLALAEIMLDDDTDEVEFAQQMDDLLKECDEFFTALQKESQASNVTH